MVLLLLSIRSNLRKKGLKMPRGGARTGAGRKAGSTDKAMNKISADRVLHATGTGPNRTPLAFMLAVMNDDKQKVSLRLQAAQAAAQFIHPKLSSVEMKAESKHTLSVQSDLARALKEIAEAARMRTIEGEAVTVLEPATLIKPDTVSGHGGEPDILSGPIYDGNIFPDEDIPDILSGQDGDLDLPK